MDETKMRELETAAQIIMNPQIVSNEMRLLSESLIMNFRKSKSPYNMCQHILEHSKNDFLQFEAAGLIKNALIVEWDSLKSEDTSALRQYLLNFIMNREDLQQFVRERILQVVAIITKRRTIKIEITELLTALSELESIFQTGDLKQQYLAFRMIDTLTQEFQITIKSDDSGLTFEDHFKAKKLFEATALMKIFVTICEPIKKLIECFDSSNATLVVLFLEYLKIMETILSWGFTSPLLPKRFIGLFEAACKFEQSPSLRLSMKWEGVILDPNVIKLFFDIYWKVRDLKELQRKSAICLVQLSTVYGSIMNKKENKAKFFVNYFNNFLQLISNLEVKVDEALPFSQIIRTLMLYNHYPGMSTITELLNTILQPMFNLTCKFAEGSVQEELAHTEEPIFSEAFTNLLEAWLTILHDIPPETLHPFLKEIFNKYLQCHLAPPHGIYAILDRDEITETEQKDRDKYKEQLTIIGAFGREFPDHSLPLLAKLLEDKIRRLRGQLLRIHSNYGPSSDAPATDTTLLDAIYEDIQWLLLITGHVLCKDYEGEEPLMSSEILSHSTQQSGNGTIDMTTSLKLLASPSQCISEIPNAETNTDHVIRLVAAVFRLCEIEKNAIEAQMVTYLSPEVSSTIMWFLKFWSEGYLLPSPNYYNNINDILRESFGLDTAGGMWTVNFLLNKIYVNVQTFTGEDQIVDDSISLLVSLVRKKHKCPVVFSAENFKLIVELKNINLPLKIKCGLLMGLTIASACITDTELRLKYLDGIIQPICMNYKQLSVGTNGMETGKNSPILIERLVYILNEIKACFEGTSAKSAQHVYDNVEFIFQDLGNLLNYMNNSSQMVETILELLCVLVQSTVYLEQNSSQKVYEICMKCIQIYSKHNQTRVTLEVTGEEDRLQDLLLLLKLMNHLLSKNFLDFSEPSPNDPNQQIIDTAEVVVYGLESIMPLITRDMLLYPNFCLQYYQTITFFLETKAHMVCSLQPEFLRKILSSVEIGLTNFSPEIQSLCFDFLQIMAHTVYIDQNPQSFMYSALGPFIKLVLDMVLDQQVGSENKVECSKALFALICTYKEQYVQIVQGIIQQRKTPSDAERLQFEFTELTNNLELVNNRASQFKFTDRFDKFLVNIGFLFTV